MNSRTALAYKRLHDADRSRHSGGATGGVVATRLEEEARALLVPVHAKVASGEALPVVAPDDAGGKWVVKNTLADPSAVAMEASEARTQRALDAGVLELALDAAESVGAANSVEKMLVHQLAAAHDHAMRLLIRSTQETLPVEITRLANASARLMCAFQDGILALHKLRTGGKQVVLVQHVQVGEGGQAVVAGHIDRGPHTGRGGDGNGR